MACSKKTDKNWLRTNGFCVGTAVVAGEDKERRGGRGVMRWTRSDTDKLLPDRQREYGWNEHAVGILTMAYSKEMDKNADVDCRLYVRTSLATPKKPKKKPKKKLHIFIFLIIIYYYFRILFLQTECPNPTAARCPQPYMAPTSRHDL